MVNDKLVKALLLDDGETLQELLRAQSVVEAMETLTYMSQQATRQDVICNVQAAAVSQEALLNGNAWCSLVESAALRPRC